MAMTYVSRIAAVGLSIFSILAFASALAFAQQTTPSNPPDATAPAVAEATASPGSADATPDTAASQAKESNDNEAAEEPAGSIGDMCESARQDPQDHAKAEDDAAKAFQEQQQSSK